MIENSVEVFPLKGAGHKLGKTQGWRLQWIDVNFIFMLHNEHTLHIFYMHQLFL